MRGKSFVPTRVEIVTAAAVVGKIEEKLGTDKCRLFLEELAVGAAAFPDDRALPFPHTVLFGVEPRGRNGVLLHREAGDAVLKQRYDAELLHRIDQILLGTDDKIKTLFHVFTAFRTSITEQPALRKSRAFFRGSYALHESKLCAP